jgi:hypothetical protein
MVGPERPWSAVGVRFRPEHVGFGPWDLGAAWPVAALPASGGPGGGIPAPGNSADSRHEAGTFDRILSANRFAGAVDEPYPEGGVRPYSEGCPREAQLPRESPGRVCQHSPRADQNANQTPIRQSKAVGRNKTENETAFAMRVGTKQPDRRLAGWLSPHDRNWL